MISRRLRAIIGESLDQFPVVGLVGSRQTGKTTLAKAIAATRGEGAVYLDLERPSDLARLADPEFYFEQHSNELIILDEVQRRPDLFPVLRALVDARPRPGSYLLLGSASPQLHRQSSQSLAGRIVYNELAPIDLRETGAEAWRTLWLRGGYPPSYLARTDARSEIWRNAFIGTYLERDLPALGVRVPAIQLRRFWEMLAHSQGQIWGASKFASGLGVTAPTVRHYLDILADTFVARQLQPWCPSLKKRLVKSPKIYLRDSGLLHALLAIRSLEQLQGHPVAGPSWEGWVIEQIAQTVGHRAQLYFHRTHAGAEIDLLLVRSGCPPIAIEIKLGSLPRPSRGLHESMADLGCEAGFIVYPGVGSVPEALTARITALPIGHLDRLVTELEG